METPKKVFAEKTKKIPKLSKNTKQKVKGIPTSILANIYIQPEGLISTMKELFPDFDWIQDTTMYPKDWIYNKKKKSIFDRKFFHVAAILNPPYAEIPQKESPRAKDEKPLKFHIAHILKIARASQIPTAILLPRREDKSWYKKLIGQPDVTTIFFKNNLAFKNMEGKYMPPANFKSILAVVGFYNEKITIKNDKRGVILSGSRSS